MAKGSIGTVVQVIGPVLDIKFASGELPQLLNAIEVGSGVNPLPLSQFPEIYRDNVPLLNIAALGIKSS